jgi:hypothetical protein
MDGYTITNTKSVAVRHQSSLGSQQIPYTTDAALPPTIQRNQP